MAEGKMLSAVKIAKELDASPKDVKRIIKEEGLEPDLVKRAAPTTARQR